MGAGSVWVIALITISYQARAELVRRDRAAQRLKQRRRVGKTIRARLSHADQCLLVGLFGIEQRQVAHRTDPKLLPRHL